MTNLPRFSGLVRRHGVVLLAAAVIAVFGCPVYELLGIPCPLCGTTRAWIRFLSGEIGAAFRCHPFFLITPFWFFAAVHCGSLFRKRRAVLFFAVGFGVVLAVFNLLRLTGLAAMPL